MSFIEKHIGRVQIITKTTKDTIAYLQENPIDGITYEVDENGKVTNYDCDNEDYLLMRNYNTSEREMCLLKYIYHRELDECEDINHKFHNEDGSISFITEFYNGGCGLDEALGDLLEYELKP